MGAERIGQIEYDVSDNIKVNLSTGRLLFTYNIVNLFKDEYNLNLNLIYNHKNELNPNMNTLLGSFFRLDINEYIQRTGNLIYYIDSLDRYYLSESYYETETEIHKQFNDESGLTLIVYKNDNSKILIKDDNDNIKEFSRLSNQSENTYYYVLTKKQIKLNDNNYLTYYYNYDSNNKLVSMYNSADINRVINFKYNDIGLLNHIYINYNNKINGVRFKYNSNFEIITIKRITNSIEEIGYVLRYSNNLLDALVDYKLKEVYTFEYDANSKLIKTNKGYINLTIKEENNKYASDYTYVSDLIIDNYVKNDEEVYVIRDIDITTNKNIIFTYNTSNSNTIVKKVISQNDEVNTCYIYYYDAFGRSTTSFEYETNNNLIYYKNTNFCKGIELLGSSNQTYEQNNNLLINSLKPYQFEDCLSNIQVAQTKINAFNIYHAKNIGNCYDSKLIYNISTYFKINQIYKNNKIVFEITYEDNSFHLIEKRINIVKTDEWFNFTCAIELEKKRIGSIFVYMRSDNDYNKYSISNMYIYLGSKSIEGVSYLDNNNQRQLVLLENQEELIYEMVGTTQEVPISLNNSGSEYYNYLSFSDLVLTYYNYLRNNNSFDLVYSSSNYSKKRIKVKSLKIKFNLSSYAFFSNIEIINESYNYFTNCMNQKRLKYENVTLPSRDQTNLLCIDTKVSIISNNQLVEKHTFSYLDLNLNSILSINEDGLKTYIEYDNYNRVINQSLYNNENELLNSISNTYDEFCDTETSILGRIESHYNNYGLLSCLKNSGIDNNPYIINYHNGELNQLNCTSDNNENRKNLIRYNNKGLIVEEFIKDQNNILNHFYEYDNYNRLSNYYRLDELRKNSNTAYNINYSYNNYTNTVTKKTRINDNTLDETKYKFDRYGNLENVYESNDLKIVYNYDYSNKLESINDFLNNINYNYTYDENNNVSNINSYDRNLEVNRYSIDFDDYGYYVSLYDDTITNENKVIYNDNLINKKVKKIYSKYHTSDYTYNNMDNVQTIKTIYANDNYGIEDYKGIKTNNYKVINGITSSLIDSVALETKVSNYLLEKFTLSNLYNSKLNMVSSYTLLKEKNVNNTLSFSNKYRHDFEYNNLLEVSKDRVSKYNSNDTVIEYRETKYTYDNLGNIISINKKYGENAQSISINRTNVYTYNNGLLERITSFDSSYRTFTYDYYGNTTNIKYYNSSNLLTKEEEFTYSFNKLIRYKVYNSNRVITKDYSYIYDHNNIRIKKINNLNNDIIDYIVYDNNVLYSDGILFIYNGNELIGFNYNDKTYSYEKDITGNIIAIIRDGIEKVRYIYDAFGNMEVYGYDNNGGLVLNNNDSFIGNINPFRYKSYYYDKESGLYYLNSRYYNSEIGRFISPDDISYLDSNTINGLNLYCYCNNNPVMYSDEDGTFAITSFLIGLAISYLVSWGLSEVFGDQIAGGICSISGGATAISTGISLLAFGPWGIAAGIILMAVGGFTVAFGANEIADGITGTNYIQEWTDWSDDVYNAVYIGLNVASAVGTIAGNVGMRIASNRILNNIIKNPETVQKYKLWQVKTYGRYSSQYVSGTLKRGNHVGQGYTLTNRENIQRGYIQWHPGSRHHFGGQPYWKVTSALGGTERMIY